MIYRSKLLLFALVAWCLSGACGSAQTIPEHDPRQARHRQTLLAESMDTLARIWSAVPAEQREEFAFDWLEPGAGALELPGLEFLQEQAAGRSFEGDLAPRASLDRLARSMDVQVIPGAFEAGSTSPLRLRIWPWHAPSISESVTVRVVWTKDVWERKEVRRATVDAGAWRAPGFDLFVTPPEGPPGIHTFRVEVASSSDLDRWVTREFQVEGVENFEARVAAVRERFVASEFSEEQTPEARDLLDLVDAGTRTPHTESVLERLEALEGRAPAPGPLGLGMGSRVRQAWRLPSPPEQRSGGVVLLIAPNGYPADAVLRGAQGAAWKAFVHRTGFDCVSVPATEPAELEALVEALGLANAAPLVCVPRGGAALRFLLALVGGEAPTDYSWVLQRSGAGAIPSQVSGLFRGLWLVDAASMSSQASDAQVAPREASPLATDFSIPRLLGEWIERGGLKPAAPR